MKENTLGHFSVTRGLSEKSIQELVAYSQEDPDIRQFTRDTERFRDEAAVREFLQPETQIYALTDNERLNGIIWFAPKPLPEKEYTKVFDKDAYDTTFAIRLYGEAKGKRLSLPFMKEAFAQLNQDEEHDVWLETIANNSRAVNLYKKFGFDQVSQPDQQNRIVMIYPHKSA